MVQDGCLQTMQHVVTMDDIDQELVCTVSTTNPVFSAQSTTRLDVHGKYDIRGICVSLCLFVFPSDQSECYKEILMKFISPKAVDFFEGSKSCGRFPHFGEQYFSIIR